MIVVDTNIISYFFLSGEHTELAEQAYRKDSYWIAPFLWRSEFRNVLALYIRKEILNVDEARKIMQMAELLLKGNEFWVTSPSIFNLVNQSKCSAYDCEFVALAHDFDVPLVTMDRKVLSNFPSIALSLEKFAG